MIFSKVIKITRKFQNIRFYTNRNVLKLHQRGIFENLFPDTASQEITDLLNSGPQTVYAGFDPTAESLHVGNLLVLMSLLHFQRAGHQVIALIGGATAQVGDPSGKTSDRPELNAKESKNNSKLIEENIRTVFENHEKYIWNRQGDKDTLRPLKILNNEDWYSEMSSVEFVGKVARQFRMGTMLNRTSVRDRLASPQGMSCAEFLYQIFQAYDWLYLLKHHECRFQIGGSDQLGNIKAGHDLIGKFTDISTYGLTVPLITTEGGEKLGKSAGNAIWLNSDLTSPFALYQYWIRQKDSDCLRLLKLFTFLTQPELDHLEAKTKQVPEERAGLTALARQVTLLVHGEEGVESAERVTDALYSNKSKESKLKNLNVQELEQAFEGARRVDLIFNQGITVYELAMKAKCFNSEHDALRIIGAGGFYINDQRMKNINEALVPGIHILPSNVTLVRTGKKNYHIIRWL